MRDEQLYAFVVDARARAAAGARRRTRWLTQQLREDATFASICRQLAAAGATVEVALPAGRRRRGRLTGGGDGVLALWCPDGVAVYVSAAAAEGVRVLEAEVDADGARGAPPEDMPAVHRGRTLADVLGDLAATRQRVALQTTNTQHSYVGVLGGVGGDVVWFDDNPWHLRVDAITEVAVEGW